ncbi:hypothetical protein B5E77_04575 [Lachnoclostridium sp. An131]|uniref:DUF6147 family protein n=1 Tax=Lachnoclostridium sp. An131 TaxID=1965555 RepID=UPI000B3A1A93|nr:DUF6147 family protein [Lachnoclostridium sp. An131]OUQ28086.1 hypothetical protein B5E77_04575 [Lachnoclostridium sp. An131]
MRNIKKVVVDIMCIALGICLWNTQVLTSRAEEVSVPGYHEYITTEDEAIDNWFGIARGTYLQSGTSGIKKAGTGKVSVSGTTNAHSVCDYVKVGVYLDESTNGGSSFGTIGVYHFEKQNASSCHGSEANISVTSGRWYCARGVHSVTEGSTTETSSTQTRALKAS